MGPLMCSVGLNGIVSRLKSSIDRGLTPNDFDQRKEQFGNNMKTPPKITPYWRLFLGALNDFMLKFLMVCAVIELAIEVGFADPHERQTGTAPPILTVYYSLDRRFRYFLRCFHRGRCRFVQRLAKGKTILETAGRIRQRQHCK